MKGELNKVANGFLPIPERVSKGLENEAKINDFELIKELGSWTFGDVYLARHKETKAEYAIKYIDKSKTTIYNQEEQLFRRIVEVMCKINHPSIVKLFGYF